MQIDVSQYNDKEKKIIIEKLERLYIDYEVNGLIIEIKEKIDPGTLQLLLDFSDL